MDSNTTLVSINQNHTIDGLAQKYYSNTTLVSINHYYCFWCYS